MFFVLPWKVRHPSVRGTTPVVNVVLIAVNILLYLFGWSWAVGPDGGWTSIPLYGFSHVGFWHLTLNMWVLWVFGDPVNRRLGNGFYLLAYLSSVVALGLFARLFLPVGLMGSSGVIFAVIAMALILMPAAAVVTACVALFPLSVIVGLLSRPKQWYQWIIRWANFSIPALWCLVLIPLMLLLSFLWNGWNWTTVAHLLGMVCGVLVVAMLPTRVTMGRRSTAGSF